jgi:hypothetical protein
LPFVTYWCVVALPFAFNFILLSLFVDIVGCF